MTKKKRKKKKKSIYKKGEEKKQHSNSKCDGQTGDFRYYLVIYEFNFSNCTAFKNIQFFAWIISISLQAMRISLHRQVVAHRQQTFQIGVIRQAYTQWRRTFVDRYFKPLMPDDHDVHIMAWLVFLPDDMNILSRLCLAFVLGYLKCRGCHCHSVQKSQIARPTSCEILSQYDSCSQIGLVINGLKIRKKKWIIPN